MNCGAQLEVASSEPLLLEPMARVEIDEEDLRDRREGPRE